ncbi:MAG: DUF1549 domain-containing protein, partial [Verrucomicrobiae bacterium]|nr:DUF1549 domain-containing protein [Verrucomicrobiae bacterium]
MCRPFAILFVGLCLGSICAAEEAAKPKPWSFEPIRSHEPPAQANSVWPKGRIDRFLLADMEKAGLKPAPEADPRTLLRRLWFDLVGLPPTFEAV